MKELRAIVWFVGFLLMGLPLEAQVININFLVTTQRPLSRLSELEEVASSGQMILTLTNLTTENQPFQIEAVLSSQTTSFRLITNPNVPSTGDVLGPAGTIAGTKSYTVQELKNLFYGDSFITGDGKTLTEYLANNPDGQIPSGNYQLCIRLRPETLNQQLTNELSNVGCANLTFQQLGSPLINSINNQPCPMCTEVPPLENPNVPFPVAFTPALAQLNSAVINDFAYTIYLLEMVEGIDDPNQLIQTAVDRNDVNLVVKKELLSLNSSPQLVEFLQTQDFAKPLERGHKYALAVKAKSNSISDDNLPNRGFSPAQVFVIEGIDNNDKLLPSECDLALAAPEACACVADSTILPKDLVDVVNVTTLENVAVQLGYFKLVVKSATNENGKFRGNGLIKNPYLNSWIQVKFDDLELKKNSSCFFVVKGKAYGVKDEGNLRNGAVEQLLALNHKQTGVPADSVVLKTGVEGAITTGIIAGLKEQFNNIDNIERTLRLNDETYEATLPLGVDIALGDNKLKFGVFGMEFTPTKATMQVIVQTPPLPLQTPQELYFGAKDLCFSPNGISGDQATLYLGADLHLPSFGSNYSFTLKGSEDINQTTSITLDCNMGFKRIRLVGEMGLDTTIVRQVADSSQVKALFAVEVENWEELMLEASVKPFYFVSHPDWAFEMKEAAIDLSSKANPAGIRLPEEDQIALMGNENTWTGLYAKRIAVTLPPSFKFANSSQTGRGLTAGFENLTIGFSGATQLTGVVENILALQGDSGGALGVWKFFFDRLALTIKSVNHELSFVPKLEGRLRFPLFDDPFRYTAEYRQSDKSLVLAVIGDNVELRAKSIKSVFKMQEGSRVECIFTKARPTSSAVFDAEIKINLNGQWSIIDSTKGIDVPFMQFTGLKYSTKTGFESQPTLGFVTNSTAASQPTASVPHVNGFDVDIKNIVPSFEGKFDEGGARVGITFALGIRLISPNGSASQSNDTWSAFGATATLNLSALCKVEDGFIPSIQGFKLELLGIGISVDAAICNIKGNLTLIENDPVFGNGLRGCVDFKLGVGLEVQGNVAAIFGKTPGANGYSYFSIDGKIENLNLMIGQYLAINGFVGGLSYNMKMREDSPKPIIDAVVDRLIGGGQCSTDAPMSNFPQVPEEGKFQLLFSVLFKDAAAGGFAFNGGMGLFSQIDLERGGVDYLAVGGFMDFIKPPTASLAIGINNGVKLRANLGLMYDFIHKELTGTSRLYINVGNVLVGTARTVTIEGEENGAPTPNEPDLAGKMALYVGSNDWYVYIGNPWAPTNLGDPGNLLTSMPQYAEVSIKVPGADLRLGGAGAYFAMGTYGIYGLPPLPPKEVLSIPDNIRSQLMSTRGAPDPSLTSGAGIAFGGWMGVDFATPWLFDALRAGINIGAGFDVALLRYEASASCNGGAMGINGFYGRGQAYAYVKGALQWKHDEGNVEDLYRIDCQMLADFGGPNPTWIKGELEFLNSNLIDLAWGLNPIIWAAVRWALDTEDDDGNPAKTYVPIELGTPCIPSSGPVVDRSQGTESIVSRITPGDSIESQGSIYVSLSKQLEQKWQWYDAGSKTTYKRRWKLKSYELKKRNLTVVPLLLTDRREAKELVFTVNTPNPSQKPAVGETVTFNMVLVLEESKQNSNNWTETEFKTTSTLELKVKPNDYQLAFSDILLSYPAIGQQFYLPNEGVEEERFVLLNFNVQNEINSFEQNRIGYSKRKFVKVKQGETVVGEVPMEVKIMPNGNSALVYKLPTLSTNSLYSIEFWLEATPPVSIQANSPFQQMTTALSGNTTSAPQAVRKKILSYSFKTSQFATFAEKIGRIPSQAKRFVQESNTNVLVSKLTIREEGWDNFELSSSTRPLVNGSVERLYPYIKAIPVFNAPWHEQVKKNLNDWETQLSALRSQLTATGSAAPAGETVMQRRNRLAEEARRVGEELALRGFSEENSAAKNLLKSILDGAIEVAVECNANQQQIELVDDWDQRIMDYGRQIGIEFAPPTAGGYNFKLQYKYPTLQSTPYGADNILLYNKSNVSNTLMTVMYAGFDKGFMELQSNSATAMQQVQTARTIESRFNR